MIERIEYSLGERCCNARDKIQRTVTMKGASRALVLTLSTNPPSNNTVIYIIPQNSPSLWVIEVTPDHLRYYTRF